MADKSPHEPEQPPPESGEVRVTYVARQAREGLAWSLPTLLAIAGLQILYTSFTSRQLSAVEFGFYAIAQSLASLLGYLSLASLGSAVVRIPDEQAYGLASRALGLAFLGGVTTCGMTLVLSKAWCLAWGDPGALPVARMMAILVLLAPINSVAMGLLRRKLKFRPAAIIELSSTGIGFAAGAVAVVYIGSAEGLVIGQAIVVAVSAALALLFVGPVRTGQRTNLRSLLSFTLKVSGQNLTHYAIYSAPSFVVSTFIGAAALGVYSRAYMLVALPLTQLTGAITRVLYPLWNRFVDEQRRREGVTESLVLASFLSCILFGILAGLAGPVVQVLLGANFADAVPVVRVLCIFGGVNLVVIVAGTVLEAVGWLREVTRAQVFTALVLVMLLLIREIQEPALAAGILAVSQVVAHGLQLYGLRDRGALLLRVVARAYLIHVSVGLLLAASFWFVADYGSVLITSLGSGCLFLAWGAVLLLLRMHIPGSRYAINRFSARPA